MPRLILQHKLECERASDTTDPAPPDEAQDAKKKSVPRRRYTFSEEARTCLVESVKIRSQGWHMIKKRNEPAEEHVKIFLEEQIRPLWPKGWMTTKILYKESELGHRFVTTMIPEKKIVTLATGTVSNPKVVPCAPKTPEQIVSHTKPSEVDTKQSVSSMDVDVSRTMKRDSEESVCMSAKKIKLTQLCSDEVLQKVVPKGESFYQPMLQPDRQPALERHDPLKLPVKIDESTPDEPSVNIVPQAKKPTESDEVKGCRPPKPSLSATVLPKKDLPDSFISIRSVDKINEGLQPCKETLPEIKTQKVSQQPKAVTLVDLSMDKLQKYPEPVPKSSKPTRNDVVAPPVRTPSAASNKLQQDMDEVMNDLLQISKQKKLQASPKTIDSSDTGTMRILSQIERFETSSHSDMRIACEKTNNPKPMTIYTKAIEKKVSPHQAVVKVRPPIPTTSYSSVAKNLHISPPKDPFARQKKLINITSPSVDITHKPPSYTFATSLSHSAQSLTREPHAYPTTATQKQPGNTSYSQIQSFLPSLKVSSNFASAPHKVPNPALSISSIVNSPPISPKPNKPTVATISHSSPSNLKMTHAPVPQAHRASNPYTQSSPQNIGSNNRGSMQMASTNHNHPRGYDTTRGPLDNSEKRTLPRKPSHSNHGLSMPSSTQGPPKVNVSLLNYSTSAMPGLTPSSMHRSQARVQPSPQWQTDLQRSASMDTSKGSGVDPLTNLRLLHGLSVSNVSPHKHGMSHSGAPSGHSQMSTNSIGSSSAMRDAQASHPKVKQSRADNFSMGHAMFPNLTPNEIRILKAEGEKPELWQMNQSNFSANNTNDSQRYTNQGGPYSNNGASKSGQY